MEAGVWQNDYNGIYTEYEYEDTGRGDGTYYVYPRESKLIKNGIWQHNFTGFACAEVHDSDSVCLRYEEMYGGDGVRKYFRSGVWMRSSLPAPDNEGVYHFINSGYESTESGTDRTYRDPSGYESPVVYFYKNGIIHDSVIYVDGKEIYIGPDGKKAAMPSYSQNSAYKKMIALKSKYPEGMTYTNANGRDWPAGNSYNFGCAAFVTILSDAAFGDTMAVWYCHGGFKYDDIRVGDILRINGNSHSVIVLEKYSTYVVIAEANWNGMVHWGRTLSKEQVMASDYIMTRYPDSPLKDRTES